MLLLKKKRRAQNHLVNFIPNTQPWYGPNGQSILPDHPQKMIFNIIHEMTHWNTDKMAHWEKQFFWYPSHITTVETYHSSFISITLGSRLMIHRSFPISLRTLWSLAVGFHPATPLTSIQICNGNGMCILPLGRRLSLSQSCCISSSQGIIRENHT